MLNICCIIFAILLAQTPSAVATNCPDAGVVVVASVFATLAVVFIVLGIIGFLIWKRRRDISRPEKLKPDDTEGKKQDASKYGYTNAAFDVEGGEGVPGYVACRDSDTTKNTLFNYGGERDLAKKTWSSLPSSDMHNVRQRKSSLGSLDRNRYASDSGTEEVWLTSQDFIGLGFNIAGSMRDGIFVSQVHNRGPANESGKFKVGDRIMHVGISFENMVYEDALTILSYASPYPVKVTLQKQQTIPKNRKLSDVRTNLNHPLYRSHSVDVLDVQSTEKVYYPKRAASEMRYCKNDSSNEKRQRRSFPENSISEEIGLNGQSMDNDVFEEPAPKVNAVVHRVNTDEKEKLLFDREVSIPVDSSVPTATVDLNSEGLESRVPAPAVPNTATETHFLDPFENLSEQDKMDMLRLSYADPSAVTDIHKQEKTKDVVTDQKSVPMKPERKKKRSSASSTSPRGEGEIQYSAPSTPITAGVEDDVFRQSLVPPTEAPPPIPEQESEADEEVILPQTKSRSVTIGSNSIVLEAVPTAPEITDRERSGFGTLDGPSADIIVSTVEIGIGIDKDDASQSNIDGEELVEEEAITATHVDKKSCIPNTTNAYILSEKNSTGAEKSIEESKSDSPNVNGEEAKEEAENPQELLASQNVSEFDDVFEKGLSELDLNLNFDMGSVLFKDPKYAKNEIEKGNSYSYDISVTELEAMEQKVREEERKKREQPSQKGGIAYEIRDDFVTGQLRTVNHLNIHRTSSYDTQLSSHTVKNIDISSQRPTSLKGGMKTRDENGGTGVLDWSGKRLVRSGSFSEIPQDDSVKVWTDNRQLSEEDVIIEKHIQEDSVSPALKTLTRATLVTSKSVPVQDQEYSSDSDSRCQSISSSDSADDNSQEMDQPVSGGLNSFADTSEKTLSPVASKKSDIISENHTPLDNNQAFSVSLNTTGDGEEDC